MSDEWVTKDMYLFIKTYPVLSRKYESLICTAAIVENKDGSYEIIRMYPVPFEFYRGNYGKLKKFTKIRVEIKPSNEKLGRGDSYKVKLDNLKVLDTSLTDTSKNRKLVWQKRNEIVREVMYNSVEELEELKEENNISLGVIKPAEVIEFNIREKRHLPKWERELLEGTQETLEYFISNKKYKDLRPIEHIPWRFGYKFKCKDTRCKGHDMMCEDWELLQLWRRVRDNIVKEGRQPSTHEIYSKVKQKFYDEFLTKRDLNFVMGTESRYNKWLIIGVYYPPKDIPL